MARCAPHCTNQIQIYENDKPGADVAHFLGVSEANVRVIRHRAIHQLRDCMGGCGVSCVQPIDVATRAATPIATVRRRISFRAVPTGRSENG